MRVGGAEAAPAGPVGVGRGRLVGQVGVDGGGDETCVDSTQEKPRPSPAHLNSAMLGPQSPFSSSSSQ